jgi:hypothetical protein
MTFGHAAAPALFVMPSVRVRVLHYTSLESTSRLEADNLQVSSNPSAAGNGKTYRLHHAATALRVYYERVREANSMRAL